MIEKKLEMETPEQKNALTKKNVHGAFSLASADQQPVAEKSFDAVVDASNATEQPLDASTSAEKVEKKNLKTQPTVHNAFTPGSEVQQPAAAETEIAGQKVETQPVQNTEKSEQKESSTEKLKLEPNKTYEKNGYTYKTDEAGRSAVISGEIKLKDGTRNRQMQHDVAKLGDEGDEGGHLIGARFNGPSDAFNLVPQNANLNRGEWKAMENEWARAAEANKKVMVEIKPLYYDDTKRPEYFSVTYTIDGVKQPLRYFENMSAKEGGFSL
jgi:hypothetical protein